MSAFWDDLAEDMQDPEFRTAFEEEQRRLNARQPWVWERLRGVRILDPDGWRWDGKGWEEPIDEDEFIRRAAISTMRLWNWGPGE